MKVSELIQSLNTVLESEGDVEVTVINVDGEEFDVDNCSIDGFLLVSSSN